MEILSEFLMEFNNLMVCVVYFLKIIGFEVVKFIVFVN